MTSPLWLQVGYLVGVVGFAFWILRDTRQVGRYDPKRDAWRDDLHERSVEAAEIQASSLRRIAAAMEAANRGG